MSEYYFSTFKDKFRGLATKSFEGIFIFLNQQQKDKQNFYYLMKKGVFYLLFHLICYIEFLLPFNRFLF
ncbi:hypothetical protein XO11_04080 [Marinitoga sp. 1138]|nr:hypothetical protein LN42_04535 [Marinitoga sp. 1137]NUU97397.1 hypothetical protein [Marinitoga sp. 1138]